jgi:hypothetical protein
VKEGSTVALAVTPREGLALNIVKGREEEPVQGWANGPWRPVPTAVIHWKAAGPSHLGYVLHPVAQGAACPVRALEPLPVEGAFAFRVNFADGRTGLFVERPAPGGVLRFGNAETDGQVAYLELDAKGNIARSFIHGGRVLRLTTKG